MKVKIFLYAFLVLAVSLVQVSGQTAQIKINFKAAPSGAANYQLPTAGENTFSVKVPKAYLPEVENPGDSAVTRALEGDSVLFSFSIAPNSTARIRAVPGGLEISVISSGTSTADAQLPPVPPRPSSTDEARETVVRKMAEAQVQKTSIKAANVDLNVPESPGFTILGLTPQSVIRPSSPREFATSLLNGVDQNGNFQTGVAIDTTPYLLFFGNGVTIGHYRDNYLTRVLSRTQLSLATTKGASENDKSARLGLGLHVTLFDRADPRTDKVLEKCFTDKYMAEIRPKLLNPSGPPTTGVDTELTEKLKNLAASCRAEWRERSLGKSSWLVGVAGSWISPQGETKGLDWNGGAFWTSLAYGFEGVKGLEEKAQLIFHARHRSKEQVPEPKMEGKFFERDSTLVGGRLRFGKPTFAGNIEGVYTHDKRKGETMADSNFRFSLGAERKIAENLYLSLSIGGETQRRDGTGNKAFVLTTFRWGSSNQPAIIK